MKSILISLLLITIVSSTISAQNYRFAAGVRLSSASPTISNSVTAKYFITETSAIEGLVSFGSRFGIAALLELHRPFNQSGLGWFYGGGVYAGFEDGTSYVGPTGIVGLDYKFPGIPLNLSLDWKPELDIVPGIKFVPDALALSARFAFK
ncbi:MAG: hypothetical protein H7Y31_10370 [Chitinophagaceae bacterium]|nr:hypothetical protein [Chitinophagaceae bacterium]